METYKKQAEMVSELEQELANSRKQENDFEEAMESGCLLVSGSARFTLTT